MQCLFKYITDVAIHIYAQCGEDAPKGEVGVHALNSHGSLLIVENHGKKLWNCDFEFR